MYTYILSHKNHLSETCVCCLIQCMHMLLTETKHSDDTPADRGPGERVHFIPYFCFCSQVIAPVPHDRYPGKTYHLFHMIATQVRSIT